MQPPFVKKYDFRGVYDQDIKDQDAYYLALAIAKTIPLKKVLVGWDTRASSKLLAMNFIQALKNTDISISILEKCPIDYVTAAAFECDFDFSVMFTGSHNPWDWTGLLMHTKGGISVQGELVDQIVTHYMDVLNTPYTEPLIDLSEYDNFQYTIEEIYSNKISSLIPLDKIKQMSVLVDIGDGSGSKSLNVLTRLLPQVSFQRINDRERYDVNSPHIADPSRIENMSQLIDVLKAGKYDCGFAFDSDADRVLGVDEKGKYINGSLLGSAMIESFVDLQSEIKTFGYAVECGPSIFNSIITHKKKGINDLSAIAVPVGRSLLRQEIRDGKVDMAVENVGHFYNKDFFMTDSGAFSIVVILYWISNHGALSKLFDNFPDGYRSQFSLPQVTNQAEDLAITYAKLNPHFAAKVQKKITVDGIRYEFFEGESLSSWYAIRPSGYEKIEKYYFGSLNEKDFTFFQQVLSKHD